MPKATTGGASNAWEQPDPEPETVGPAVTDAAGAQPETVAVPEPDPAPQTPEPQPGPAVTDQPLATGGVVSPSELTIIGDGPAPLTLPPGWTEDPPVPAATAPQADAPAAPQDAATQPPEPGD